MLRPFGWVTYAKTALVGHLVLVWEMLLAIVDTYIGDDTYTGDDTYIGGLCTTATSCAPNRPN